MRQRSVYFSFVSALFLFALVFAQGVFAATDECNLSKPPFLAGGCPAGAVGAASPNPAFRAARLEPKSEGLPAIDAFGFCRYVDNSGDVPGFAPFSFEEEWRAYLTNHPAGIQLTQCSRGGAIKVPPNFGQEGGANQCVTLPVLQAIVAPYKRLTQPAEFTAPPISYVCKSADGAEFTETAVATLVPHDSGYGPSDDIGWRFSKILYSYDGMCGSAQGVTTKTAPTSGLCHVGVPSAVIGLGPFQWVCASGTGGGHNRTCGTGSPCVPIADDVKPCHCEGKDNKECYRPIIHSDSCGHTVLDKSQTCDAAEPRFAPLPQYDDDNPNLYDNKADTHLKDMKR
jgi:hypothetical protein